MSWDFKIGSTEWRKCINDKYPYERATAPFRKEQFDSAPTVGDQSLTGWWTRGQFSFHKGAGVEFYEVLDGQEVLNRARAIRDLDPWTPGKVKMHQAGELVAVPDRVWDADMLGNNTEVFTVVEAGTMYRGTTVITPTVAGTGRAVCAHEGRVYFAVDNRIEVWTTGTTTTLLWTNNVSGTAADNYFVGVWFGKDRLWAVAANGNWFALSPTTGGTLTGTPAELFWSAGKPFDSLSGENTIERWVFAETPGAIIIGYKQTLYRVTINADGTIPTLSGGVVAGELGRDDWLVSIKYHLGYLAICGRKRFRVAAVSDQGNLTIGPPVLSYEISECHSMATDGDSVFFIAKDKEAAAADKYTLYEVNLSHMVEELVPAWIVYQWRYFNCYNPATRGGASFVLGSEFFLDRVLAFGNKDTNARFYSWAYTGTKTSEGTVLTGYHRLGTLEKKLFYNVTVRTAGTGGNVFVYVVDADGTETYLDAIYSTDLGTDKTFALNLPAPVERIAFKFVLWSHWDGAKYFAPELLGYQLRALPMPQRQRLIRVPLMLFDTERSPGARAKGKEGSAWTRLEALEALEASNALVSFEDRDTGETGTALIESVEVRRSAATTPRDRSNGFGGVVNVTLRKVD